MPPLRFKSVGDNPIQKINAPSNKIGWLHSLSDKSGAKFDLTIRDGLGRVKLRKTGCGSEHKEYGELINLSTNLGEELQIEVSNLKNAESVDIFLN